MTNNERLYRRFKIMNENTFYSLVRNTTEFNNEDKDKINQYVENLKERFQKENSDEYYYSTLSILKNDIMFYKKINKSEAVEILIKTIDPNFDMYQIYYEMGNIKNITEEIKKQFNFFSLEMIKKETDFIKYNQLEDIYSFEKKLIK